MMFFVMMMVVLSILLACAFGVVFFIYKSICSFKAKRHLAGLGFILLSFILGIFLLAMFPLPPHGLKEKTKRAICMNNLKQIILFTKMYAVDHENKYPVSFNDLVGTNLVRTGDLGIFTCPGLKRHMGSLTNINSWTDYTSRFERARLDQHSER